MVWDSEPRLLSLYTCARTHQRTSHAPLCSCVRACRIRMDAMAARLLLLLSLASLLACAAAQAPGDGSAYCLTEYIDGLPNPFFTMRPVYGEDVWPLMDSRDYMSLLLGDDAVWQHVDADANNMQGVATNVRSLLS